MFYTSLSSTSGLICLLSERTIVDLENLESVAPNEEQISITARIKCSIVLLDYSYKDNTQNSTKLMRIAFYQELDKDSLIIHILTQHK